MGDVSAPRPASHAAPPWKLTLAVNKIPGRKKKIYPDNKIKHTPSGLENQYISSGKGEKYPGCESAAGFRISAKTGAKKQNHILLLSVEALDAES